MNLAARFRTVVAMWIFVGLVGGPFAIAMGVASFAGAGPFQPMSSVRVDATFAPGQELKITGKDSADVGPGDFVILASPATVEPAAVTCEWKSRVYTTGEQRSGTFEQAPLEGFEPVVIDGETRQQYRPVTSTAGGTSWMEASFVTCTGDGVETFAVAEDGSMSDAMRTGAAVTFVGFGVLVTGLGFLALHVTRQWRRQAAAGHLPGAGTTRP